jgi:hypothetical protein
VCGHWHFDFERNKPKPVSLANLRPWQRGESGNPRGRRRGSRNRLTRETLARIAGDGERADRARLLRIVKALVPQQALPYPGLELLRTLTRWGVDLADVAAMSSEARGQITRAIEPGALAP